MLRLCRVLVLLAACVFELAGPCPVHAQAFNNTYSGADELEYYWNKKRKRYRKIIIWSVIGVISASIGIFMMLNAADRKVARKALLEQQLERQRKGLA